MKNACRFILLLVISVLTLAGCTEEEPIAISAGQGEMAGEVTADSVILQSRLTTGSRLLNGDLPGAAGVARFEVDTSPDFADPILTAWLKATPEHDFIVKAKIEEISADTRYRYRLRYGPNQERTRTGATRSFRTHPGPEAAKEVSFVVVTGMNHWGFHHRPDRSYTGPDKVRGYPALETILRMRPAFFVGTGDNVYYDIPYEPSARNPAAMRRKWHEQFVQPRYIEMFAEIPTYWEKDDHDYRYNDCDNTSDLEPSVELGAAIFREQVPIVDPTDPTAVTYRTHRVSRDLQIWLTEGRDYRSPNMMASGPEKSLWGAEQREWLQRTLLESDATFKILISPTPMIGPDDANQAGAVAEGHDHFKRDNHSNPEGFQAERDSFFEWLKENSVERFYIVCGDRHWQYHSIHPTGFEEFSTGALVDGNSRLGRNPGDPESNDPDALIQQPYTSAEPTGGFLHVTVTPGSEPTTVFRFFDEKGELLHEVRKKRGTE